MAAPLRVAVFGNGFARGVILPCLRRIEGVTLAGIASPNQERARATAEAFGIEHVAADHREILAAAAPELVFIATPPHRHAEMAIDALQAGCHVVCEKPTALNSTESSSMLAAARAARQRVALIDHELRFHPGRMAVGRLLAQERLGEILLARYTLRSPTRRDPTVPWSWWSDLAQGGGALGAIGSHSVDSLRSLLDSEVTEVRGLLHTHVRERIDRATGAPRPVSSDDLALAWLRFASGTLAEVSISMVEGPRVHRLEIAGGVGSVRLDEQSPLGIFLDRDGSSERPVAWDMPPAAELGIPDTDWARSFLLFARRLIESIRAGEETLEGAATFEDGHRNQLVLDAIRRSAEEGGWVRVPSA